MRVSEIYNLDIYSDNGQYLGEVKDAIVDLEKGEVSRVLMEEWKNAGEEEVKRMIQQKSILFKNIKNISDVVLVSSSGSAQKSQVASSSTELSDLAGR
ncbi:PRC-barrel domain-containing protein [Candidatus Marsarchaeota archaeon]|nr:PRC-barrel domain-containing protein [Candidatus Marsarchaeota archaeon]MCL5404660.1 PRC-barrel domain-containing protein [Candidatus Marsarchaeota archaeon]